MKEKNGFKRITEYHKKQIFVMILIIIFAISIMTAFGRYAINAINNAYTKSKEFYFNSDKLGADNPQYQIENWSGVDDYTITINLNSLENNLLKASYSIDYSIQCTCSNNLVCSLSKNSGTILSSTNTDSFNILVTPNAQFNTGDTANVYVTVSATEPYETTLTGTFTFVVGQENLTYKINDTEEKPYFDLEVTNTLSYYNVQTAFGTYSVGDKITEDIYKELTSSDKAKCYSAIVTISFDPTVVRLDMTNENYLNATNVTTQNINGYTYINGMSFKVADSTSTNIRFYKLHPENDYTYPITNSSSIITLTSI